MNQNPQEYPRIVYRGDKAIRVDSPQQLDNAINRGCTEQPLIVEVESVAGGEYDHEQIKSLRLEFAELKAEIATIREEVASLKHPKKVGK